MNEKDFVTKYPDWQFDILNEESSKGYTHVSCCFNKSYSLLLEISSYNIEGCFDIADKLIPLIDSIDLKENEKYLSKTFAEIRGY